MFGPRTDSDRAAGPEAIGKDFNHVGYLPFVDGLRAVSILAVVAYHIGLPGVPGGFVGVDIFFLISGFLIINQIKFALSSNRFSIWSFYAHRGLRILPLYFIMLLTTFAVAPFVLTTPAVYWDFIASAATAPLMVSNVTFYLTQGYFDISGIEKPLLHTWTLSVEEQFYFAAPIILLLIFRLGNRRFGLLAVAVGIALGAVSLAGAIEQTSSTGRNAAFYLAHWRAWEFLAGGFIGGQLVSAVRRLPAWLIQAISVLGAFGIVLAIAAFSADMPYPSYYAVLPVASSALVIVCGLARPDNAVARFLALRWLVAIGLVSYAWYLWHWPILSFLRIARVDQRSLLFDSLGGGVFAFAIACLCYRYVERPIRQWRKLPGRPKNPLRLGLSFVTAGVAIALIGAATAYSGYRETETFVASRYGINGLGVLHNGCDSKSGFSEDCFEGHIGILVGDSHATVLWGTFAKQFDALGVRLVSMARGGCPPYRLAPSQRNRNRTDDCARLIAPYERLLHRRVPISFAIISSIWGYSDDAPRLLSEMLSEFDPIRTRILLIGPVPMFPLPSLECVALSDRFLGNRDRCETSRKSVEALNRKMVGVLKAMPQKFKNVRFIDPTNLFCDQTTCRPFKKDQVFYLDSHHLSRAGASLIFESFKSEFLSLADEK
jgi:peptidoglycan/LPS O-acetylase OafA/YrhL